MTSRPVEGEKCLWFDCGSVKLMGVRFLANVWIVVVLTVVSSFGQGQGPAGEVLESDFPFLCSVVDGRHLAPGSLTPRGILVSLDHGVSACFDTDLLRLAAAWTGGSISMDGMATGSYHAEGKKAPSGQMLLPRILGEPICSNGVYPGWVREDGKIEDPRPAPPDAQEIGRGPMGPEIGRWNGLYIHGRRVIFDYQIGDTRVREEFGGLRQQGSRGIERRFSVGASKEVLQLVIAQLGPGGSVNLPELDAFERSSSGHLIYRLEPSPGSRSFKLRIWTDEGGRNVRVEHAQAVLDNFEDGGPSRWPEPVVTRLVKAPPSDSAWAVDEIRLPVENPWQRKVRAAAIDFFSDGRAAVVTFDGDVWLVDGIDTDGKKLRWHRFASGLHEPMSLRIRDDEIFVFTRSGIMRLHDLNGDGEADRYENFCSLFAQTAETREFAMDMAMASDGSFILAKGGQQIGGAGLHNGSLIRVAADGRSFDVMATGLRQPYVAVHPELGRVTATDQQGHWVPSTPIHLVKPGDWFGFKDPKRKRTGRRYPDRATRPLLWIPHVINQSAASQVWCVGGDMGPLDGSLIHIGYEKSEIFKVFFDLDGEIAQGGIVKIPVEFPSALLKGVQNPRDGRIYLAGFRIWGSEAKQLSGVFRLRSTGRRSKIPRDLRCFDRGIFMRFDVPLDREAAAEVIRYRVRRWNYLRSNKYGSGHYRLDGEPGEEELGILAVHVSADGCGLILEIPGMSPAMQIAVDYRLPQREGLPIDSSAYLTAHALRPLDLEAAGFSGLRLKELGVARLIERTDETKVSVELGSKIFHGIGCIVCHSTDGTTEGKAGPTVLGLAGRVRDLADGKRTKAGEDYLRESILDPSLKVAKGFEPAMPSFRGILSEKQIDAVILYLRSLRSR